MIEIANIVNSPIVEITVNDKLTQADIQEIDSFFESRVSDLERVNILLLMSSWEGLTFKGLLEDFKLMKYIKNMNKAAIVADSEFLKADSKVENLFPGVQVKYFETDEQKAAREWLET